MIPRRIAEHVRSQNWFAVAVDFVIVVLGVFIGFQVDNWWTSRSDARREQAYLQALQQDFAQVIGELEGDAGRYRDIVNAMLVLLAQSRRDQPDLPVDELNRACGYLLSMVGTSVVSDTYDNLKGSGDLRLIRDQELKNRMAEFFAQVGIIDLVSNTHEMQLVNVFQPYVVRNLDYFAIFSGDRKKDLPPEFRDTLPAPVEVERILRVLPTAEFRNVLAIKFDISTDNLDVVNRALSSAREVDALLRRSLNEPG